MRGPATRIPPSQPTGFLCQCQGLGDLWLCGVAVRHGLGARLGAHRRLAWSARGVSPGMESQAGHTEA